MASVVQLWNLFPVVVRTVALGGLVCLGGTLPWGVLAVANMSYPTVPWAVPIMIVYLWYYLQYLNGWGWPKSTTETRRGSLRLCRLPGPVWAWSLLAGASAMVSLVAGRLIVERFVNIAHEQLKDYSRFPSITVASILVMTSTVAGFAEEAGFRGYMQAPLERRYGALVAIAVSALAFAFAHFPGNKNMAFAFVPYITAVGVVYGVIAFKSGSIWPTVILHIAGDSLIFLLVWLKGPPPIRPLVWESGIDTQLRICFALFVLFGALSLWAFRRLMHTIPARRVAISV